MPSRSHQLAAALLKATRRSSQFADEASLKRGIAKRRPHEKDHPGFGIGRRVEVSRHDNTPFPVFTFKPKQGTPTGNLIFSHGGAYTYQLLSVHWQFAAWAAQELQCTVHVPVYPLAPEHSWRDTYPTLLKLYGELSGNGPLWLAGDSAGGGMSLALAQLAAAEGLATPDAIVLISPWLDATLDGEEVRRLERRDVMLSVDGLLAAGRMWAGDDDPARFEVSPTNGKLEGLPRTLVLTGTADLLNVDARSFAAKARAAKVDLEFIEEEGLAHDYVLFPIPEGRRARTQIAAFLRET